MSSPWFSTAGLTKDYATRAVDGVDLTFAAGEIHALLGANGAGKSTLCRMIAGLVLPTSGRMWFQEREYAPRSKRDAERAGVQIVQQELNLIPNLDVAENLYLSRLPHTLGWMHRATLYREARSLLDSFGLNGIDARERVDRLGIGQQQMLEIASNLSRDCRILILDEPTAALTASETQLLFGKLLQAKARGVAILYISHRLEEIRKISDRISILRDGGLVGTWPAHELDQDAMVAKMTYGDTQDATKPWVAPVPTNQTASDSGSDGEKPKPPILFRAVDLQRGDRVRSVSFSVSRGEILGIAGLVGSGRTELLRLCFGADAPQGGALAIGDVRFPNGFHSPAQAVEHGIVMIGEDRKSDGLLMTQSLAFNVSLACLARGSQEKDAMAVRNRWGWYRDRSASRAADAFRTRLAIRCNNLDQPVGALSGGNQQKVVLAKWLLRGGSIFLFDEPTRGIDVAARATIYETLRELSAQGKGVIVVSSDLEELKQISHRMGVMSNGRWIREFRAPDFDDEEILRAMFEGYQNTESERCS
jgi:ribose transport system ATP-binding protein